MADIDYSKYGATPQSDIDYSQYGAAPSAVQNIQNQPQQIQSYPTSMTGDLDPFNFPQDRVTRAENEGMLMAAAPPLRLGEMMLGGGAGVNTLANYALNKLGSFGAGTAMTTGLSQLDPNNQNSLLQNLGQNATGNALIEGVGPLFNIAKEAYNYAQPGQFAESILNKMGGGQTIADNAKIFANKIQNAYNIAKSKSSELYNDVFNSPGVVSHGMHSEVGDSDSYLNLPNKTIDNYSPDLQDLHDQYINNPSLFNAHLLQSQLGSEIRSLQKMDRANSLSVADRGTMQNYKKAQSTLQDDMSNAFDSIDPSGNLKNKYNASAENHLETVIPYESNPKLNAIVKTDPNKLTGKMVNNISNEFKNPNENMQQIANDIGPEINNHILFDKLGQMSGKANPDKLSNSIADLKNQGYGSYISPELDSMMQSLSNRNKAKLGLEALPGAALALGIGHGGLLGDAVATGILAPASIGAARFIQNTGIKNPLSSNLMDSLSKIYKPLARTSLVNNISNQPNQ